MRCPECHAVVPEPAPLCPRCGTPLGDGILSSDDPTRTMPVSEAPQTLFAGKYRILERIGSGGMGVVYKAEDIRLERTVALKFLSPELSRDEEAKSRFIREARSAAALDHPHICTVYEVDEAGEDIYISMAFIKGQSLKDRLAAGPLGIDEAQALALQVAEGVHEAHEKGIIHRDIKPANIMLTAKGEAKIMDFGLAKLAGTVDLTKPSTILGTVAYMSPEQARGEPVDHRTDIWSFGALFYEILTRQRPFWKEQEHALIQAILNDRPKTPRELRPDIPRAIERIVMKALEKDRARRSQSMGEVLGDLKAAQQPATGVTEPKKSIIVLPFENISPDPEQDYFCDGMTEELIADLSHIRDLLVISRSSAMTFKGTKKTAPEIARAVNVRYVLEGSVRKAGKSLRITAQLIDADTDDHLWAEKYNGLLDDVFDIQEKVSRSISEALKLRLTSEENQRIQSNPISNVYAYECFLKARYELWKWTEEGLDKALAYLKKGMDISGENPVLLAGMGYVYYQYVNSGFKADDLTFEKAKDYTNKALRLDPESPVAQVVLALLQGWSGHPQKAVGSLIRVLDVEPNNFDALVWFPCFCSFMGKNEGVGPYVDRLLAIEPLHPMSHFTAWLVKVMAGEFTPALNLIKNAYGSYPDDRLIQWGYAQSLVYCGLYDQAFQVMDQLMTSAPDFLFGKLGYSLALGLRDRKPDTSKILMDPKIESWARRDFGASYYVAEAYAAANEKAKALTWLEHAVDLGFLNFPFLNEHNPMLESIRSEPRFRTLMERVKREWEQFEV